MQSRHLSQQEVARAVPPSARVGLPLRGRALPILFILALILPGCASLRGREVPPPDTTVPEPAPAEGRAVQASFYDHDFTGKKTASGEIFDPKKNTAAHRSLPFGTVLELRRPGGGGSVRVRVNDRGPFVKGRELDLSPSAATALGIDSEGVASVEMRVVEKGNGETSHGTDRATEKVSEGRAEKASEAKEGAASSPDAKKKPAPDAEQKSQPLRGNEPSSRNNAQSPAQSKAKPASSSSK